MNNICDKFILVHYSWKILIGDLFLEMVAKWWCGTTARILNNLKSSLLFCINPEGSKGTGNLTELSTASYS